MTPLQIIRAALQKGYTLELTQWDDGYHIVIEGINALDQPCTWEIVDGRLDQALARLGAFTRGDLLLP